MSSLFDRLPLVLVATELSALCSQHDQLALAACSRMMHRYGKALATKSTQMDVNDLLGSHVEANSSSSTAITEHADADARRAVRLTLQRSALRILTGAQDERSANLQGEPNIASCRSSQQLALWLRGPGYRSYHNSSIEVAPNPEGGYDLFERGWLGTTSSKGVVISRAVGASQSDIDLSNIEDGNSSELLPSFQYPSDLQNVGDQDPSSGSILASTVPNSASNFHMQAINHKDAASSSQSPLASISSTWSLLNRWSLLRLRHFLYSIEQLSNMRDTLQRHGALCNFGCPEVGQAINPETNSKWGEATRNDLALLGEPVPFLLPWPYAVPPSKGDTIDKRGAEAPPRLEFGTFAREEEQQILDAWSSGRSKEDWDLSLMCCDFDYEQLQPPFVPMLPQHEPDFDYDQMSQLLNQYINEGFDATAGMEVLSGTVRGNAWVCSLANVENVFDHRIEAETKWVAKKINEMLRITPACQGAVFPRSFAAGYRHVDVPCDEDGSSRKKKAWKQLFQSKPASESDAVQQELPQEVAEQVRKLMPSSMLVNVSSEHVLPWPCLLVAPIAPGWVGGFISAASLLEG